MPVFGSDQLKCSLVQNNSKPDSINYVMSRADGTILNEIDIGQEEWPYSYPTDKKFFNWKFIDHTPDMKGIVQLRAMQEAFNSVQKITALTIDFEKDATPSSCNFCVITFRSIPNADSTDILERAS